MQIAGFLLDYNLSIENAFNLPRIDVNENDVINVDVSIDSQIIKELENILSLLNPKFSFPKTIFMPKWRFKRY